MLKLIALVMGCLVLSSVAWTQSKPPVTVAEADAVLQKIDSTIRAVLKMKQADKKPYGPDRAVTRAEVVAKLDAMYESYKPHFQYTPRPFRLERGVAERFNPDEKTQKRIEKLVRWGFLAPVGPVVTGPKDTLSIPEFADAVGYFMSQTAALTYFADPKWVPNLQPPGAIGG